MRFVAVTSCPTGIAHTYMAAESLEQSARAAGHEIDVETQGSAGSAPLSPETIAAADAVIFAADLEVRDRSRFDGKPLVNVGVKKAISDGPGLIAQAVALAEAAPVAVGGGGGPVAPSGASPATTNSDGPGRATRVRQWLMTGVSYMIPFVAAGGLLIALSFMVGGYKIVNAPITDVTENFNVFTTHSWAALMFWAGSTAFSFLVPALAGYIAYAIADRPGITPGFVGGALAVAVGAGFLGGIVAGFLGGFVALYISRAKVPSGIRSIMPVVVTPLVSTFVVGIAMLVVLGPPLKGVSDGLTDWLNGLSGSNLVFLGIILGLMMGFDLGGPVNKVAYVFATTGLTSAVSAGSSTPLKVMAATMAAGMVPPLGMALATVVRKRLFTVAERENGKAAWVLGASFISEGAIPFAAADPLRVIPSSMLGAATTGAFVMIFGNTLRAPHGGIWVTPLIGSPFTYLLAILIGTVITAASVIGLKEIGQRRKAPADVPVPSRVAATA